MVGGFFMSAGLMVLCCFAMMFGRLVVMMGSLFMMFVNFRHGFLPVSATLCQNFGKLPKFRWHLAYGRGTTGL